MIPLVHIMNLCNQITDKLILLSPTDALPLSQWLSLNLFLNDYTDPSTENSSFYFS